ncbi:hypothetical protein POUND7_007480 [Theobroma cacao]
MECLLMFYQLLCLLFFCLSSQPTLSSSSFTPSATPLCSHNEASALMKFKSSFSIDETASRECEDTSTPFYPKTDSWKEGTDCCSWDGVTCDNITSHVIGLDLSCSWLYGVIPSNSSLFHLPRLQNLNLAHNDFNDSNISSEFAQFTSLKQLNLTESGFAGQIPLQISHLSKLVSLDLSRNYYRTLDERTLGGLVQNLTEVRQLFLDGINMSSINPIVLMNISSSLSSLSLEGCGLQGKFPENIFHLPNLKLLNLRYNHDLNIYLPNFNQSNHLELLYLGHTNLSGALPNSIGNLVSLRHLDLSFMNLSGALLNSIGNLVSLEYLDLSFTNLSGAWRNPIGNLLSLKYLSLSGAPLCPSSLNLIRNLVSLEELHLKACNISRIMLRSLGNYFSGQIPSSLTNLSQLKLLDISHNQLEGSIPNEVTAFPNLIHLDLSFNFLNGTLPSWLYTTSSLKSINLQHNQLSGYIKQFQHISLEEIFLQNNKLQGLDPSSMSQLVNLTSLDLSSNNLSGIEESDLFSKVQNPQYLDLSNNNLYFNSNHASADYTLPNLQSLDMSSCNVNQFPQFLRGSKALEWLDLSNNRIYGKIPKWMWDVGKDSLFYLNLSHNSMTELEQLPWKNIRILDLKLLSFVWPLPESADYLHKEHEHLPVISINAGCINGAVELDGVVYSEDDCYVGGDVLRTDTMVGNGVGNSLYNTTQFGDFSYEFSSLEPGFYNIDLHFAEIVFTSGPPGIRVFDVFIQQEKVVSGLDKYGRVGANKPLVISNIKTFVDSGGGLLIRFEGLMRSPIVCGITVRKDSPASFKEAESQEDMGVAELRDHESLRVIKLSNFFEV